ncbi:SDR family NAD(P)-dependent oxidoreductase [Spiribacter halobius]|uniref:Oxidoreductase n=1 Tax=Sediminicurvatus halobius TaxID=2182432 RepID=A0A2U2MWU6_9GAMM|nr:SDR family NAD(P)-dependent oxidoreductase [Spiribacter halobius]PWG61276.1 oxidoreductase [Spiribacter halobius]UEX78414.1 SDR family NAD(P)-dependent oxidoreductase [Spiribacter halobius]
MHDSARTDGRIAFISGASAGIGRALAERLARDGWQVVISSRRAEALEAIREANPQLAPRLHPRVMDVTDAAACAAVFAEVESSLGEVDTLILNAGDYDPMRLDDFDPALFRRLAEVNYLGAVNGVAAALGPMRRRGRGQILVTASLSAYRGLPRAAPYGASKAAVLNMAEALRPELEGTGVALRVINPGFVRTRLTDKNDFRMPQLITPEQAADYIARELDGRGFEIMFPKRFGWTLKLLRLLPYRLYFALTRRMVGR